MASDRPQVALSFDSGDQRGALNRITPESRQAIMSRVDATRLYDLSVDFFLGMPTFSAAGDPPFQIWMTHTPRGTLVDDLNRAGREINERASYSGDVVLFYTHTGTHIDALNHLGYHGVIYNGYEADDHLGSRHWQKSGAEQLPPIVARGVLLDVAGALGLEILPPSYGITVDDCAKALAAQATEIREGDVVLVRTGQIRYWPEARYLDNFPGITLETARWLAEQGIIVIGADNGSVEQVPPARDDNWLPVHCYLLAEMGIPLIEQLDLEELARDRVYEFCFIGGPIRLRGATGAPLRPLAFPLRES